MEPFFIRCETCRARLRVRDERFLGQVQSCPKCGSMVQIIAPAVVMPQADAPAAGTEASVAGATSIATLLRSPPALVAAGGAAVLLVGGLVGMLTLGGEDEVAQAPTMPPAVEVAQAAAPTNRHEPPAEQVAEVEEPLVSGPLVDDSEVAEPKSAPDAFLPLEPIAENNSDVSEPATPPVGADSEAAPAARTLTLEVVESKPSADAIATSPVDPPAEYANVPEVEERVPVEAAPPVLAEPPDRRTNVDDQLSVAIDTIELPAMPIGKFVKMISEMSAVPIRLDPKVLGDAGLSTQTKVVVQGGDITLGDLLARVLKEHQLTCVERDGELVVVRAKQ